MNFRSATFLCICLCGASAVMAQATRPAAPTTQPRPVTAQQATDAQLAFHRGQYALALPILQREAEAAKDDPAKLAPINQRISICEKALAAAKSAPQAEVSTAAAAPLTDETRKPHPVPKPGEIYDTTIKNLGNFEYDPEKGGNIPADVMRLSGSTVRLHGFMIPMDQAEKITQFALVPSLFACCFGQPPQIQHTIVVNCPKGKSVAYSSDELVVEGTLKVEEKKDDGYVVSLFELKVNSVKVAPKSS